MTQMELQYMTLLCKASDEQEGGSCFVGNVGSLLPEMAQRGFMEKQVWECQRSLRRAGLIRLHLNFDVPDTDVDPNWSTSAPELTITRAGLRWWFVQKHGQPGYAKLVRDLKRAIADNLPKGGGNLDLQMWADTIGQPLLVVQRVIHAERLL